MQPEIRSFVSVLRSPVMQPFDSANFTKNANCFEAATFLATKRMNSAPINREETKVESFGKESAKLFANTKGAIFWQEKVQNSSPILAQQR